MEGKLNCSPVQAGVVDHPPARHVASVTEAVNPRPQLKLQTVFTATEGPVVSGVQEPMVTPAGAVQVVVAVTAKIKTVGNERHTPLVSSTTETRLKVEAGHAACA